jgi:hypothetical protein
MRSKNSIKVIENSTIFTTHNFIFLLNNYFFICITRTSPTKRPHKPTTPDEIKRAERTGMFLVILIGPFFNKNDD